MAPGSDHSPPVQRLGPWRLLGRLGRGSTGEVWEAIHDRTGLVGAVKVMSAVHSPSSLWAFNREVHAATALDHRHVIDVLDAGEVPDDTALLEPGAPYLVMELCPAGTLKQVARTSVPRWPFIHDVLCQLLLGLGHAHARGVLHRDLKPSNVLIATRHPVDVRIADFGLARTLDDDVTPRGNVPMGTPHYMAPEQILGNWRDFGPWTDLYALGGVAWTLLCGHPPHGELSGPEALFAALSEPLPPLKPRMPIPAGFEAWLRRLLARDPHHRYGRAIDALEDLDDLADGVLVEPSATPPTPPPADPPPLCRRVRLPPEAPLDPVRPRSLSPRLLPYRHPAIVARRDERRALWHALRRADREATPGLVLLTGPSGVGRTRLAGWLAELAHATGCHLLGAPPGLGIPLAERVLTRHFRARGLDDEERTRHLRSALGALGVRTDPTEDVAGALAEACTKLQGERPVLVWLDDAHTDPDALKLAGRITRAATGRILVLVGLPERLGPRAATHVQQLRDLERCDMIEVGPLDEDAHRTLVRALARLCPELEDRVVAHTLGNPAFAFELLREWSERGVLVESRDGLRLGEGVSGLPASLHALWTERIARLLPTLELAHALALRVLAVFGPAMPMESWELLCTRLTLDPVHTVELLGDLGCVQRSLGSVAARPPALRRALLGHLATEPDRGRVHGLCADLISGTRGGVRRAAHLLLAGRGGEAMGDLVDRVEHRGHAVATTLRRCLEAFRLEPTDLAWGWLALVEAAAALQTADTPAARDALRSLGRTSRAQRAWAAWLLARVALLERRPDDALDLLARCTEAVHPARRTVVEAAAHLALGRHGLAIDGARAVLDGRSVAPPAVLSAAHTVAARSFWTTGLLGRARAEASAALTASEGLTGLASPRAALVLGEVLLAQGHRPAALRQLQTVAASEVAPLRARAHAAMAAVRLHEGDAEGAARHLELATGPALAPHRALARAGLAAMAGHPGHASRALAHVEQDGGLPDPTALALANVVADAAMVRNQGRVVTTAWALAERWVATRPSTTPRPEPPPG